MRAVIERVGRASVVVDGRVVAEMGGGFLVYVGVERDDEVGDVRFIGDKIRHLRVFPDDGGALNLDVVQAGGDVLLVSAFTVAADARRGRRPSFDSVASAEVAEPLYLALCRRLEDAGVRVFRGCFGAEMQVSAVNDGPICMLVDSRKRI